jgi:chloramphenicol 3-O-phosphotransferase
MAVFDRPRNDHPDERRLRDVLAEHAQLRQQRLVLRRQVGRRRGRTHSASAFSAAFAVCLMIIATRGNSVKFTGETRAIR